MRLPCQVPIPASSQIQPCRETADEYIIFGCINQHISEMAFCGDHALKWLTTQRKYRHTCRDCDGLIEDYIAIQVTSMQYHDGT